MNYIFTYKNKTENIALLIYSLLAIYFTFNKPEWLPSLLLAVFVAFINFRLQLRSLLKYRQTGNKAMLFDIFYFVRLFNLAAVIVISFYLRPWLNPYITFLVLFTFSCISIFAKLITRSDVEDESN
ncbi:MAG: ATP synthase subunit I [Candidatus Margulisbacteria bacterium]|nr:ATP synthase subunit I [Candidatus Margulisiibacteriota bacterium]